MGHKVVVFDISVVRALWETRVKKHKVWQKKEAERLEKSALEKYVFLFLLVAPWRIGAQAGCGCVEVGASFLGFPIVSDSCSQDLRTLMPLPRTTDIRVL